MKRYLSKSTWHVEKLLTNFLLVGLLCSSSAVVGSSSAAIGARLAANQEEAGPTSVRSAPALFRNYALTTVPGQRTAGDASKQNSVKYPVNHRGLAPRESGAPPTAVHQLLVSAERSVSYLSFRLSRPGGRAPPALA